MASDIVSYRKDSNDMESSVDSKKACCVKRSEVSKDLESERDISCLHTRTSEALAHTCKYDKIRESSNSTQKALNLPTKVENLESNPCHTEAFEGEVSNVESKQDFSPMAQNDKILETIKETHKNPAEVSLSDVSGFTKESKAFGAKGEGSCLEGNDQALSEQSAKSSKKTTQILESKTHKSLKQLILFFYIGGSISLADFAGFYILYKIFGVHYILASLIMFVLASGIGVWLYRRFVFGGTHLHRGLEVGLTYLINTIGIGLNTLILWLCVEFLGFEAIVAKILASLLVAFYGFYARKLVIYRKEPKFYFYTKSPVSAHKGVDSKFIKKECQ
ncbi:GtrA family protein [Helicobacter bilis]|uniref:GtrA family protein n=1 Tax=Helicobacter bilis TaxID=37372 RepID=UPI001F1A453F|nr:GtrA family protein [Helicobacter bilis]